MKKLEPDRWISTLANVGVIAGIVFLGSELRQNNELMAEQQRFNRLTVASRLQELVLENPHLAQLAVKAEGGLDQLTAEERIQMAAWGRRMLDAQEWTFLELPRQDLPVERWRQITAGELWRSFWDQNKNGLDPDFVRWMEENVIDR